MFPVPYTFAPNHLLVAKVARDATTTWLFALTDKIIPLSFLTNQILLMEKIKIRFN